MTEVHSLLQVDLVFTEKMDGSNVCLERNGVYARSHNEAPRHESFNALKALHASLSYRIPASWQVFGEWLWAKHSIFYDRLPAFLLVFGIRDQAEDQWLAWEEVVTWSGAQGLSTVPVLWQGICPTEAALQHQVEAHIHQPTYSREQEGVVVRVSGSFSSADFSQSVGKWVRPQHVQTSTHWREQKIVRNLLSEQPLP